MGALGLIVAALRPRPAEVIALAKSEADVSRVDAFGALSPGPLVAFVGLLAIGLAGAAIAPYRLAARALRRAR